MRPYRSTSTLLLLVGLATNGRAEAQARLTGWADEAVLLPRAGASVELFRLSAGARWSTADDKAGPLSLEVVGPAGQSSVRRIEAAEVGAGRLSVYVPSAWVKNLRPEAVAIEARVVDASGRQVARPLRGGIEVFPSPNPSTVPADPGPFGWGKPLNGPPGAARPAGRVGPDGWRFVRIPGTGEVPGFSLATTEASIRQVRLRVPAYDPRSGRSDDFLLEDPAQPAVGLTPSASLSYLDALRRSDPNGPIFRLPSRAEWLLAARTGRRTPFWWGEAPANPDANLLGDEPALQGDSTAPVQSPASSRGFRPNPWGLFHTFGNVEEWTTDPSGGFVRLGGHLRTEPAAPLPESRVDKPDNLGPDPFVGLRPAYHISAERGAEILRGTLSRDSRLRGVTVAFDPDRATATLGGSASEPADRRQADALVGTHWWVEAVENRVETPQFAPGTLARLGQVVGPVRQTSPLGRTHYEVPVTVRWADRLPVSGSEWWVNVYPASGQAESHRLVEGGPDGSGRLTVVIDRASLLGSTTAGEAQVSANLSLGGPAPRGDDPKVVSNALPIRLRVR